MANLCVCVCVTQGWDLADGALATQLLLTVLLYLPLQINHNSQPPLLCVKNWLTTPNRSTCAGRIPIRARRRSGRLYSAPTRRRTGPRYSSSPKGPARTGRRWSSLSRVRSTRAYRSSRCWCATRTRWTPSPGPGRGRTRMLLWHWHNITLQHHTERVNIFDSIFQHPAAVAHPNAVPHVLRDRVPARVLPERGGKGQPEAVRRQRAHADGEGTRHTDLRLHLWRLQADDVREECRHASSGRDCGHWKAARNAEVSRSKNCLCVWNGVDWPVFLLLLFSPCRIAATDRESKIVASERQFTDANSLLTYPQFAERMQLDVQQEAAHNLFHKLIRVCFHVSRISPNYDGNPYLFFFILAWNAGCDWFQRVPTTCTVLDHTVQAETNLCWISFSCKCLSRFGIRE